MAVLVKHARNTRVKQSGARGLSEALLTGPALGCSKFTVRRINLDEEGCTAAGSTDKVTFYFILSGKVVLSHQEGELDPMEPGTGAVTHPGERHHLRNIYKGSSTVLAVKEQ